MANGPDDMMQGLTAAAAAAGNPPNGPNTPSSGRLEDRGALDLQSRLSSTINDLEGRFGSRISADPILKDKIDKLKEGIGKIKPITLNTTAATLQAAVTEFKDEVERPAAQAPAQASNAPAQTVAPVVAAGAGGTPPPQQPAGNPPQTPPSGNGNRGRSRGLPGFGPMPRSRAEFDAKPDDDPNKKLWNRMFYIVHQSGTPDDHGMYELFKDGTGGPVPGLNVPGITGVQLTGGRFPGSLERKPDGSVVKKIDHRDSSAVPATPEEVRRFEQGKEVLARWTSLRSPKFGTPPEWQGVPRDDSASIPTQLTDEGRRVEENKTTLGTWLATRDQSNATAIADIRNRIARYKEDDETDVFYGIKYLIQALPPAAGQQQRLPGALVDETVRPADAAWLPPGPLNVAGGNQNQNQNPNAAITDAEVLTFDQTHRSGAKYKIDPANRSVQVLLLDNQGRPLRPGKRIRPTNAAVPENHANTWNFVRGEPKERWTGTEWVLHNAPNPTTNAAANNLNQAGANPNQPPVPGVDLHGIPPVDATAILRAEADRSARATLSADVTRISTERGLNAIQPTVRPGVFGWWDRVILGKTPQMSPTSEAFLNSKENFTRAEMLAFRAAGLREAGFQITADERGIDRGVSSRIFEKFSWKGVGTAMLLTAGIPIVLAGFGLAAPLTLLAAANYAAVGGLAAVVRNAVATTGNKTAALVAGALTGLLVGNMAMSYHTGSGLFDWISNFFSGNASTLPPAGGGGKMAGMSGMSGMPGLSDMPPFFDKLDASYICNDGDSVWRHFRGGLEDVGILKNDAWARDAVTNAFHRTVDVGGWQADFLSLNGEPLENIDWKHAPPGMKADYGELFDNPDFKRQFCANIERSYPTLAEHIREAGYPNVKQLVQNISLAYGVR